LSSHYWYWIHTVESRIDLDDYNTRLKALCETCSCQDINEKKCDLRMRTKTTMLERNGHKVLRAFCYSDYYEAKINIDLEDTGLLHMVVDLCEISVPIYARINWLKKMIELYPHSWYSDDDVHMLTSTLEERKDAIDDIGKRFYDTITNSFDLSFIPNEFNQITADAKVFMIFSESFTEIFPELDKNIKDDLDHLLTHLQSLLEVKMRSDEVYWNYRSSVLVERLTILTVLLSILSLAVAFVSEYLFGGNAGQPAMDVLVITVVMISVIAIIGITVRYKPLKKSMPHSNTITKEAMHKNVDIIKAAALHGDANAQLELGHMYEGGIGVEPSSEEATVWYRRAANNGNADAQFNLGVICEDKGTEQSYKEAAEWYMKAIKQGHVKAHNYYGELFKMGWGVEMSYEKAGEWYLKAAEMGDVYGQYNLACLYEEGKGVEQSYDEAAKWFTLAAKSGDMDAQYHLAMLYKNGNGVEQSYEESLYWLKKSAEQGMSESVHEIGVFYENGFGLEVSLEKAEECYRIAEELGSVEG